MNMDNSNRIVAALGEALSHPSDAYPSVQWMSERHLIRLLIEIRNTLGISRNTTGKSVLASLIERKLAKKLAIANVPEGKKAHIVYCLRLGQCPEITPIELLLSTQTRFLKTALCYYTAIQYHELSVQVPAHHHIASFRVGSINNVVRALSELPHSTAQSPTPLPSLGTLLFHHQGIPYYTTSRDERWIPGVQSIWLSDTLLARVTTLEQTLLDTLHNPWSCGGPAVAYEAWENGCMLMDEGYLSDYLHKINRIDLVLRVGYMLEQCGHTCRNNNLSRQIEAAKRGLKGPFLLLPDVPANTLNKDWGLYI